MQIIIYALERAVKPNVAAFSAWGIGERNSLTTAIVARMEETVNTISGGVKNQRNDGTSPNKAPKTAPQAENYAQAYKNKNRVHKAFGRPAIIKLILLYLFIYLFIMYMRKIDTRYTQKTHTSYRMYHTSALCDTRGCKIWKSC